MRIALHNTAFWDVNPDQLDEIKHADFIITRVFEYGLLEDIKLIMRHYTIAQIKKALTNKRGIDRKALALANVLGCF